MNDLVDRASSGDADAVARLIEVRQERMTRIAVGILGSPSDDDDALQGWLVSLWRNLPSLRETHRFDAWSDRFLVNACRRILRSRGRDRMRLAPLTHDDRQSAADHDNQAAGVERDALERAFETLSTEDMATIILHHLEGHPLDEIADRLGVPAFAAASWLERRPVRACRGHQGVRIREQILGRDRPAELPSEQFEHAARDTWFRRDRVPPERRDVLPAERAPAVVEIGH